MNCHRSAGSCWEKETAKIAILGLALLLGACGHNTQTTSGSAYLDRFGSPEVSVTETAEGDASGITEADIIAAANVEPTLRFPARIGLARIDNAQLTAVPKAEAAAWRETAERLGPAFGEFVPISPLIAALASKPKTKSACWEDRGSNLSYGTYRIATPGFDCVRETVQTIRLGAARQHVDAVLIYESFGKSDSTSNPLAVTKLALIGYFLPTENVEAEGLAQAILVDVRNGYHYGTATAVSEAPSFTIASTEDLDSAGARVRNDARISAVQALTREVEAMAVDLRRKLESPR